MRFLKDRPIVYYLLFFIVLIGVFFRFYNLNWDGGYSFHPDERNIAAAVSRIRFFDQLNPRFFAYGSLPIYLYRAIGELLAAITKNSDWVYNWGKINLIGRSLSAFLSSCSIFLVFAVSKKIWNDKVGVLASFLFAFSPSLIQTAHFSVTETMLVFWLLLILLFSFDIVKKTTVKNYLKIGFILGLATATKITAIAFAIIPVATHFLYHFKYLKRHFKLFFLFLITSITFSCLSPYAFLDKQKFLESMRYEVGVSTGKLKVCYTFQFDKTLPYFFQIKNFFWQMGPAAFLGILGTTWLLVLAVKKRSKKLLTTLSFPLIYFFYAGSWHTKFIRYMVPVLPFLAISAAWFLFEIHKHWKTTGKILIGLACLTTSLWALAFFSIYTRESTRITASKWIYQNIPRGSKILGEHWDDGLPVGLGNQNPDTYRYDIEALTIYEPDNAAKIEHYAQKLSTTNFIIINSRRLYGTLMYLPEKYPITSRYYQFLFNGKLGYQKMAQFTSYPSLFGLKIRDNKSEETFQVYDHPKVLIFKNQKKLSKNEIRQVLR